jgi:hypothetical protein
MNNQNNKSPFNQPKKNPKKHHASFVEALKNIGSGTVQSFKDDLVKGTARDAFNSVLSPQSGSYQNENMYPSPDQFKPDWWKQQENDFLNQQKKQERHREVTLTPVYDRREEEVKAQIQAIRDELQALAQDLGKLGQAAEKAIAEEIEQPGTYHLHFFVKFKQLLLDMKKRVNESGNWLELSAQRKAKQSHYWGGVKKAGTKFMLSHDRAVATQTG